MTAAGNGIIGEHHVIKWPIAKILIIPRDGTWNSEFETNMQTVPSTVKNSSNVNHKNKSSKDTNAETKGEILIRYQRTPAVVSNRSLLVYTLPKTRGMCCVLDFWPTSDTDWDPDDGDRMRNGGVKVNALRPDLSWFEPL